MCDPLTTTIVGTTRGVLSVRLDVVGRICSDRAYENDVGSREWPRGNCSMVAQDQVCRRRIYGRDKRNRRSSGKVELVGRVDPKCN